MEVELISVSNCIQDLQVPNLFVSPFVRSLRKGPQIDVWFVKVRDLWVMKRWLNSFQQCPLTSYGYMYHSLLSYAFSHSRNIHIYLILQQLYANMHTTAKKSTGHDWAYVCKTTLFGCNFPGAMAYWYEERHLVGQVIFFRKNPARKSWRI